MKRYGTLNIWRFFNDLFDYIPIAAVVGNSDHKVFCVHGGLSPRINTIDQIQLLDRGHELSNEGILADLLWSDPEEGLKMNSTYFKRIFFRFRKNPRGCGYLFNAKAADLFNYWNGTELICRAHQLARSGYQYFFPNNNCLIVSYDNKT